MLLGVLSTLNCVRSLRLESHATTKMKFPFINNNSPQFVSLFYNNAKTNLRLLYAQYNYISVYMYIYVYLTMFVNISKF